MPYLINEKFFFPLSMFADSRELNLFGHGYIGPTITAEKERYDIHKVKYSQYLSTLVP